MKKKLLRNIMGFAIAGLAMIGGQPAQARSSWYVSFSTGPVWYYPAPIYCRPIYYPHPDYSCPPPPLVAYPAPVYGGISVGYYHRHRR